jgi:hypothetical protein
MKKILLILTILILSFNLSAKEIEIEETKMDTSSFLDVAKEGDLKLTGNIALSEYNEKLHYSWKGIFDYYLTDYWSFSGIAQISLKKTDYFYMHSGFFALNLHPFHIGDLDFYGGGGSGYTLVIHDMLQNKLAPTVLMHAGWTYYGSFFCITGEIGFKNAEYYSENVHIDLSETFISGGIGFKI